MVIERSSFLSRLCAVAMVLLILGGVNAQVTVIGAMRNTMFNGQLAGLVKLDSIAHPHAYGLGPMEFLKGEILLLDGHVLTSTVSNDSSMRVQELAGAKAPFFVHQTVDAWRTVTLPDSITDLDRLDAFLVAHAGAGEAPFAFRMVGRIQQAEIHVVALPEGAAVHSPEDAHQGQRSFALKDMDCELIGFFSTRHKAVFTHHDSNLHVHLSTQDRRFMGHLDSVHFDPRLTTLYLPSS